MREDTIDGEEDIDECEINDKDRCVLNDRIIGLFNIFLKLGNNNNNATNNNSKNNTSSTHSVRKQLKIMEELRLKKLSVEIKKEFEKK